MSNPNDNLDSGVLSFSSSSAFLFSVSNTSINFDLSISSFLRLVGAEMPSNSDQIRWAEQGRLHIKYTQCTASAVAGGVGTFTIADAGATTAAIRIGQTVFIQVNATGVSNKAIVTAAAGLVITVAFFRNMSYKEI